MKGPAIQIPSLGLISSTWTVAWWLTMLRCVPARLRYALDLARLFDLPDRHPDRMIAMSIVLYIGLGIISIVVYGVEPLESGTSVTGP